MYFEVVFISVVLKLRNCKNNKINTDDHKSINNKLICDICCFENIVLCSINRFKIFVG